MKFYVKNEIKGRIRIHLDRKRLDCDQADILQDYLERIDGVSRVKVYERTADAAISYQQYKEGNVRDDLF